MTLLVLLSLLTLLLLYLYLKPLHPLSHLPVPHFTCHILPLWILHKRFTHQENAALKAAHARHGPIVRVGPREVSVNCVRGGIGVVYTGSGGGFEKGGWYGFFANFGGIPNMFSTPLSPHHSTRKRMLSNIYSKSTILTSAALSTQTSTILYTRFLPYLLTTLSQPQNGAFNIYALLSATTMDIVTAYIFGLKSSSNLIDYPDRLNWFLDLYNSRRSFNFWPQELPRFTEFVSRWFRYDLVPRWVGDANREIENWTQGMCDSARRVLEKRDDGEEIQHADTPVVYQQLTTALQNSQKKTNQDEEDIPEQVASELLDHLAAGFDTSGITLTYLVHELSLHPSIQSALRAELLTLSPPILPTSAPNLPDAKQIDTLPLLQAIIWETLRLHPAIPGPQPRLTPAAGCKLGVGDQTYWIPGGVRVSASAGILHANNDVFPGAEDWKPERWLQQDEEKSGEDQERRKEMDRWFWAFGSGGRMCVGSHLAIYQMKFIIAAIYSSFTTHIVDDSGIAQSDAYTAPPKSDQIMIRLSHAKAG